MKGCLAEVIFKMNILGKETTEIFASAVFAAPVYHVVIKLSER
ncbi:MAG: hypothetical protein NT164_02585 [Verrucomicrobiae bacterium]|nr:hypothetical protein [Verrucomicrobiae bacterium]